MHKIIFLICFDNFHGKGYSLHACERAKGVPGPPPHRPPHRSWGRSPGCPPSRRDAPRRGKRPLSALCRTSNECRGKCPVAALQLRQDGVEGISITNWMIKILQSRYALRERRSWWRWPWASFEKSASRDVIRFRNQVTMTLQSLS